MSSLKQQWVHANSKNSPYLHLRVTRGYSLQKCSALTPAQWFWPTGSRCLCVSAQIPHRYPHSLTHGVVSWVGHNYTAFGCSLIKFDRPLQLCSPAVLGALPPTSLPRAKAFQKVCFWDLQTLPIRTQHCQRSTLCTMFALLLLKKQGSYFFSTVCKRCW